MNRMDVHCIIGGALILSGVIFATKLAIPVTIIMGILVIIKGIIEADQD